MFDQKIDETLCIRFGCLPIVGDMKLPATSSQEECNKDETANTFPTRAVPGKPCEMLSQGSHRCQ